MQKNYPNDEPVIIELNRKEYFKSKTKDFIKNTKKGLKNLIEAFLATILAIIIAVFAIIISLIPYLIVGAGVYLGWLFAKSLFG